MSLTSKDVTLQSALQDFGIRELPKEWKPESNVVFLNGIALVRKVGGIQEYCRFVNNGFGLPAITKDYGTCAAIVSIDAIYPVEYVEKKFVPDLRSNKAIIAFLSKNGHNENVISQLLSKDGKSPEQIEKDKAIVKDYINQASIAIAKKEYAERERCANIRKYAENAKAKRNGKEKEKDND